MRAERCRNIKIEYSGSCNAAFEGVAVEVNGGRFTSAIAYAYDALPDDADAFERLPDGSLRAHPEWQNAPVLPLDGA